MSDTVTEVKATDHAPGTEERCARVLAARERVGRPTLAAHLGISQSACWRWERNRVQVGELKRFNAIDPKLADLPAGKPVSRSARIDQALALVADTEDLNTVRAQLLDLLDA